MFGELIIHMFPFYMSVTIGSLLMDVFIYCENVIHLNEGTFQRIDG